MSGPTKPAGENARGVGHLNGDTPPGSAGGPIGVIRVIGLAATNGDWSVRGHSHRAVAMIGLALVVAACANSEAEAPASGDQLVAAGFVQRKADSPERIAALQSLPPHQFVVRNSNGSVKYLYADPIACDCIYVGGQRAYNQYRQRMVGSVPAVQLRAILSTAPLPAGSGL